MLRTGIHCFSDEIPEFEFENHFNLCEKLFSILKSYLNSQQISSNRVESGLLRDVPFDVLQLIFETLDLPGLLTSIESDEAVLEPAIYAFKHTLAKKLILIDGSGFENHTALVEMDVDRIVIKDYETALSALKYFGNSISRLGITYKMMNSEQIGVINGLIDEKYLECLKAIQISCDNNELDGLTTVFPNVVNVSIIDSRISTEILRLDRLFPQMRSLDLERVSSSNTKYLQHHFAHLENFTMKFSVLSGWFKESELENTLKSNPQIKYINILPASHELATKISQFLPSLEYLELTGLAEDFYRVHSMIRFKNVKKFKLTIHRLPHFTPRFIPFEFSDRLEEFELNWNRPVITHEWLDFTGRLTNLKQLKIKWAFDQCSTISYVAKLNLPNLEMFTVENVNIPIVELNRFFDASKAWNKLHEVRLLNVEKTFLDEIKQNNQTEWEISEVDESSENLLFNINVQRIE